MTITELIKQATKNADANNRHVDWEVDLILKPMSINDVAELDIAVPSTIWKIGRHKEGKFGHRKQDEHLAGIKNAIAREIRQRRLSQ